MSHVGVGGRLIRHHGDYHLGQTLLRDDRWIILDFEGEPARSLLERRRKRSPLRDVAGMLRSFAYAASASRLLEGHPAPDGWEDEARRGFLEAYLDAVEPALLPAGRPAIEKLLQIFELEKAVYELRYELNNRPDWVPIPVAGIARLLESEVTHMSVATDIDRLVSREHHDPHSILGAHEAPGGGVTIRALRPMAESVVVQPRGRRARARPSRRPVRGRRRGRAAALRLRARGHVLRAATRSRSSTPTASARRCRTSTSTCSARAATSSCGRRWARTCARSTA